jgi:hypothetical protein
VEDLMMGRNRLLAAALAAAFMLLAAVPAAAQVQPIRRDIADFPACDSGSDGVEVIALDPADGSDCTVGGGSEAPHPCVCNGSATTWVPAGRTAAGDLGMEGNAIRFVPAAPGAGETGEVIHIGTSGGTLIVEPLDEVPPSVDAQNDGRTRGGALCASTYCSGAVPCDEGQGGCNATNSNCRTGLFCRQNIGRLHSVAATAAACTTTTDICLPTDYWCGRTCTATDPCRAGQGDCAGADANCTAGLVCAVDAGTPWGCGATVDVCQAPNATVCNTGCTTSAGQKCELGEGDCETSGVANPFKCVSGTCTANAGAYYGCPWTVGICE